MADEPNTPPAGTPPAGNQEEIKGGQGDAPKGDQPKTFTQDDVNKIVSERVGEVSAKFDKKLEESLRKSREDWERQAKLSDEEKQKEARAKEDAERAERERVLTLRENKLSAIDKLNELKIPIEFADYLLDVNAETMGQNIDKFSKLWNDKISEEKKKLTAGEPPKDPNGSSDPKKANVNSQGVTAF